MFFVCLVLLVKSENKWFPFQKLKEQLEKLPKRIIQKQHRNLQGLQKRKYKVEPISNLVSDQ